MLERRVDKEHEHSDDIDGEGAGGCVSMCVCAGGGGRLLHFCGRGGFVAGVACGCQETVRYCGSCNKQDGHPAGTNKDNATSKLPTTRRRN